MKKIILSLAALALGLGAWAQPYVKGEGDVTFRAFQSTSAYSVKQVGGTPFSKHYTSALPCVDLDEAAVSHEYLGIGVSMTDASCYLVDALGAKAGKSLLKAAFGADGLGMNILRLNCGASDYATALYNYNDVAGDVQMKNFSIERDRKYMIPVLKKSLGLRDDFYVFSSVWSVPGWMKDSGQMCGGKLLDESMPAFANYWAAYLKAYEAEGIHVEAITVQNEPLTDQGGANPATLISGPQEALLAGKYLPEAFASEGLKTGIWVHDHNYNYKYYDRLCGVLADPAVQKNIAGVAFHPYSGTPEMMLRVREQFPGIPFHLTERGMNLKDVDIQNEKWCADLILGSFNYGCSSYCAWNLALDHDGQPMTGKFNCKGLFEVDVDSKTFTPTAMCSVFRHIGPYVRRGASVLKIDQPDDKLTVAAFRNPDGRNVVIIACDNLQAERHRVQIKYKGEYLVVNIPLYTWSITTLVID